MARFDIVRQVKRSYLDWRIRMCYGTTHPTVVTLADGRHQVSIDPTDPRARKKVASDAIRGKRRRNQVFWVSAINALQPNVALDVGVNFGECLFQADYPSHTTAFGIDGNPGLLPHLIASRDLHPQGPQIEVINALVAEEPAEAASFFVSQRASGGSTAAAAVTEIRDGEFEEKQVPVTSVDTLVESANSLDRIVFKIDVEGYEGHVLRGMVRSLANCESAVGLIEFDTQMLTRAGESLEQFWDFLRQQFDVSIFVGRRLSNIGSLTWNAVEATVGERLKHTDLLLIGGSDRQIGRDFATRQFGSVAKSAA